MGVKTDTRQRMVTSAALLIRERGVAGTSVAGVLEHSNGPRGSVGFHFPGGRAELLADALRWVGGLVSSQLRAGVERGVAPADLFRQICEHYRRELESTGYAAGCPIGAAAQEAYADSALGPIVAEIIDEWAALLAEAMTRTGREPEEASDTALLCISAMEGAITLARVKRSPKPIDLALAAMLPVLSGDAHGHR
ncbi:TetR/AcrR family transcriptional regulator [Pseudonocardia hispaniensis]|uniref:TetR/AcrR family transcriptional regulator n=1 Tax=Pseudonocardia hispaniensis TaxID=904933 RepID=A0ABW1IZA7_9PSEU